MIRAATPGAATPHKSPRDHYARTVCDCEACRATCYKSPGFLIPGDFERIVERFGPLIEVLFRASGCKIVAPNRPPFQMPLIVPTGADTPDGCYCAFLAEDASCKIHPAAPYGCSHLDTHQTGDEVHARTLAGMYAIAADQPYKDLWQILSAAGLRAKAPE